MPKIFISYRRDDSAAEADRIYEYLVKAFGKENIIKDVDSFTVGSDFRTAITEGVIDSDIVLVLIGEDWLTLRNASGQRRIDDPDDFVRYEVDLALRRAKMLVIPVILSKARPPGENELPNRLRELAYKNAAFVRNDPDFDGDMQRLIRFIRVNLPSPKSNLPFVGAFVGLLVLLIAGFIFLPPLLNRGQEGTNITNNPSPTDEILSTEEFTESPGNTPTDEPTATDTPTDAPTITPSPEPTLSEYDAAIQRAVNFNGTANHEWTPVIYSGFGDEVPMALVPAGCFEMGENGEGGTPCMPIPAFWIDETEVSQSDFDRLGVRKAESNGFIGDNLPVENITWFEARDYCLQQGKRLPTEAEWEYAARGVERLIFPWGNEFDNSLLNYCDENCPSPERDLARDDGYATTAPVGSFREGVSWVGALDMAGNVWEWTSSPYSTTVEVNETDARILRGGSWNDFHAFNFRASTRVSDDPHREYNNFGFRCVRDLEN